MIYNSEKARLLPAFCRAYHAKNAENPVAANGSSAVFAFANGDIFSSKSSRVKNLLSFSEAAKMPIKSGFLPETLARILEKHGFLIYELLFPYDIKERYFKGRKDGLSAFENICIAEAVLKK